MSPRRYIEPLETDPIGRRRSLMLIGISLGGLVAFGSHLIFPALLVQIKQTFGLSNTVVGGIITLLAVINGGMQYPSGFLSDAYRGSTVLLAGLGVFSGSVVLIIVSTRFVVFVASVALMGFATGLLGTSRYTTAAETFPKKRDFAFGVVAAAGNLGTVVLPVVAGFVALRYGWRKGFVFLVPLAMAAMLPLWLADRNDSRERRSVPWQAFQSRAIRTITALRDRRVLLALVVLTGMTFVYYGLTSFFPLYLVEQKSLSQSRSSTYYSLLLASGVVSSVLAGSAADRFGPNAVLVLLSASTAVALISIQFVSHSLAIGTVAVLFGGQMGIWPVAQSYVIGILPDDIEGGGLGVVRTLYLTLGALGPIVVGVFVDVGQFSLGFAVLAVVAALLAVQCLWLPR